MFQAWVIWGTRDTVYFGVYLRPLLGLDGLRVVFPGISGVCWIVNVWECHMYTLVFPLLTMASRCFPPHLLCLPNLYHYDLFVSRVK